MASWPEGVEGRGRQRRWGVEPITLMSENGAQEVYELLWVRVSQLVGGPSQESSDSGLSFRAALFAESSFQAFSCLRLPNSPRVGPADFREGWASMAQILSLNHLPGEVVLTP